MFYLHNKLFIDTSFFLSNKMAYGVSLQNLPMNKQFEDVCCQLKPFAFVAWEHRVLVVDFYIKVLFTVN